MSTIIWVLLAIYIVIGLLVFVCSSRPNKRGEAFVEALFWPVYLLFLIGD